MLHDANIVSKFHVDCCSDQICRISIDNFQEIVIVPYVTMLSLNEEITKRFLAGEFKESVACSQPYLLVPIISTSSYNITVRS